MRSELKIVMAAILKLDREQLPELFGEIEVIRTTVLMQLSAPTVVAHDDQVSVEEAAQRLGVSTDYLYRNWKRLPFTRRMGRKLLFSSRGMNDYIRKSRRTSRPLLRVLSAMGMFRQRLRRIPRSGAGLSRRSESAFRRKTAREHTPT